MQVLAECYIPEILAIPEAIASGPLVELFESGYVPVVGSALHVVHCCLAGEIVIVSKICPRMWSVHRQSRVVDRGQVCSTYRHG